MRGHFLRAHLLLLGIFSLSVLISPAQAAFNPASLNQNGYLEVYKQSSYYELDRGSRYADKDLYQDAVFHLERAIELNPVNVLAQYNLAYSLMRWAEEDASSQDRDKRLEEAEWTFRRVRDLNPNLTLTYYKLGKLALMREDYKAARDYYQSGVDNNPENAALYFNLAAANEKLNDLSAAEKAYLETIRVNPKFVYAHNNLGLLYERLQEFDKAESVYREALSQMPEYNYARLNLGSLLQLRGRLDEAGEVYQEAVHIEPENSWAHLYLGNTHYRLGRYQQALEAYQTAIKLNPNYPATYYLVSLALEKLNRPEEAIAHGLQYINMAPNGAFSQEAGDLVMTLQHLQQAKKQVVNYDKP